jgi:hypothetical protein
VAAVVLVCASAPLAGAETSCTRDGSWVVCADGRRYAIRLDPFARAPIRGDRAPLSGDVTPEVTDARPPRAPGGVLLRAPDGLVCWPHGDHAHCQ